MKIYLVRHGDHKNDKLNFWGRLQAKILSHELKHDKIEKIYCSPKNRAKQTAKIISKNLKINKPIVENNFVEREQLPENYDKLKFQDYYDNYLNINFSYSKPEGCKEFCQRVFCALDEIIEKNINQTENILIVGHSCLLYAFNAYFNGIPQNGMLTWMCMGNCSKICFEVDKIKEKNKA